MTGATALTWLVVIGVVTYVVLRLIEAGERIDHAQDPARPERWWLDRGCPETYAVADEDES